MTLARQVLVGALLLTLGGTALAADNDPDWRHATALNGEPKYPPGFERFDYVNPNAPVGGVVRLADTGTFDTLNFVPPKGTIPSGLGLVYDSLMTSSFDEVSSDYGLIADAMKYPEDYSWVTYRLRPEAQWHDGMPITPDDVVFSFESLKEYNPQQAFYYRHVVKAEKTGDREVTFTFDETGNRELPHIVGQLLILPKHWWEGTAPDGKKRDISAGTLERPLGSGAYRIGRVVPGRTISYERVDDYWAKDLNVNVGANNFDEIRYEYFRDETVEFQAFKADQVDWRQETTARVWSTQYNFPAVRDGRVIKQEFEEPYRSSGLMVGFIFNLRRDKFQDPRLREAFNLAFPFEEINKSIFYGLYKRPDSYFFGNALASSGLPQGLELEILETVRDKVPESVFTTQFTNPVNTDARETRNNLRKALQLLKDAGYKVQKGKLINVDSGEPLTVEFLMNGPRFEKIALRYKANLEKLGIELKLRAVDSSQYVNRVRSRDFDMIYTGWAQSLSPGNEQLDFFSSAAAARDSSRNYGGITDPAVDELINRIIFAKDREELEAATKAMDRVLLANHYIVPGWTSGKAFVARWDRFGKPDELPYYAIGFPTIWWWDEEKADGMKVTQ